MQPTSLPYPFPENLQEADSALRRIGKSAQDIAWELLSHEADLAPVRGLKKQAGIVGDEIERLLIWHAAQQALPQVVSLPIDKSVCARLIQDLPKLATLSGTLEAGSYHYERAAKMVTLRRFSAGPMEWEISGIPRSFFLQASLPANLKMLAFTAMKVHGFKPCFFMHVAPAPRNRALSIPKEVLRAYYRMVKSLELQPDMLALLGHAWFHDPAAVRDNPQLEVINRPYVDHGGLITTLAPAPADSGVLEGNAQRRQDYLSGKVQYRYGFAIWPRDAAIRWATEHPELAE